MAGPTLAALPDGLYGAELDRRISEATAAIRERLAEHPSLASPRIAMVLGSGLGDVVELLDAEPRLPVGYGEIPNVPGSAVVGHAGKLVAGTISGTPAIILSGRAHPYEGYSHREATLLLRAVLALGPRTLVLTNAAGGLNPEFDPGDEPASQAAPPPAAPEPAPGRSPAEDLGATLERLAGLRDKGLITPEEYEAKKAQILERM